MNVADIVTLILLLMALAGAIALWIRTKRHGGCCGNCNGCTGCADSQNKNKGKSR